MYELTLREEYDGGDVEHTTLATVKDEASLLRAIRRRDDAYKCYVTCWDFSESARGEIVEQQNAEEWLEQHR